VEEIIKIDDKEKYLNKFWKWESHKEKNRSYGKQVEFRNEYFFIWDIYEGRTTTDRKGNKCQLYGIKALQINHIIKNSEFRNEVFFTNFTIPYRKYMPYFFNALIKANDKKLLRSKLIDIIKSVFANDIKKAAKYRFKNVFGE
jgi:hypothetical protein